MVLEHAPVTGLALIVGVFSSALTMDRYLRHLSYASAVLASGVATTASAAAAAAAMAPARSSSLLSRLLRLSLESIPFGPHGTSLLDIALTSSIVYQMRVLERRWGSSAFLAFLLSAAGVGIGVMHVLVTESTTPALTVDALRVVSAGASLVPLVALVTRYVAEVPNAHTLALPIPLTRLRVTEKALVVLPLLKLVVAPNSELQASGFKRRAIHMDIGGWNRLLLGLVGVLFAVFATKSLVLRWSLRALSRYVCRPLLLFLDPVLHVLFATRSQVQHILPKRLAQAQEAAQQQQLLRRQHARAGGVGAAFATSSGGHRHHGHVTAAGYHRHHHADTGSDDGTRRSQHHGNGDGVGMRSPPLAYEAAPPPDHDRGRFVVDSLAGPDFAPMWPPPNVVDNSSSSNNNNNNSRSGGDGSSSRHGGHGSASDGGRVDTVRVVDAAIAQIEELGLGVTRAQIAQALTAAHGDVDAAVHLLIDS